MAAVAEKGRFSLAFTSQESLGIHDTAMRFVATLLVAEVDRGVAGIVIVRTVTDLLVLGSDRTNAFH